MRASDHTNMTICACTIEFSKVIEASRDYIAPALALFGVFSNLITILVLLRFRMRSSTENLLLVITVADLALPVMHLSRQVYVSTVRFDETDFFRILIFYLWHVFSAVSALITLVLALRRLVAIEYPHKYQSFCNRQLTNRILIAVCVFSAVALLPMLIYSTTHTKPDGVTKRGCKPDSNREILYTRLTMASVWLSERNQLKFSYWLYVFGFELLCPLILAVLSVKFKMALNRRISSSSASSYRSKSVMENAKTKLILIVSLLALIRDLPLGLLSTAFLFARPHPSCLTTVRLLTKELTILMSALNFFVLYYTNKKFRMALPWCRFTPQESSARHQEIELTNETSRTNISGSCNETPRA